MVKMKTMAALAVIQLFSFAAAIPRPQTSTTASSSGYWLSSIKRQGTVAFSNSSTYQVFRNVMDFGAKGDGTTDDTVAINQAISSGSRCGLGCDSSTVVPAIVYFPPGTYLVKSPLIQYYYTQFIGDAISPPTIKADSSFSGIGVIDSDPYEDGGANWYTNQNNFFRQIRNFVIDLTGLPATSSIAGIHWQVAQATSLQNIVFNMNPKSSDNQQQGIFMDNGSGGFFSDLVFNGGNYGAFLGNQQFTTRNLTFNNCNTAIFMNWNWAWTFKSLNINGCNVGVNMSNGAYNGSVFNQTVGSVLILDSTMTNTPLGVITGRSDTSAPTSGGTLILKNVDFTSSHIAVSGINNDVILLGGQVVDSWAQGSSYASNVTSTATKLKRRQATPPDTCAVSAPPAGSSLPPSSTVVPAPATPVPAVPAPAASDSITTAAVGNPPSTATEIAGTFSGVSPPPAAASGSLSSAASSPVASGTAPAASTAVGSTTAMAAGSSTPLPVAASSTTVPFSTNTTVPTSSSNSTTSNSTVVCSASSTPVSKAIVQGDLSSPQIPTVLMSGNNVFERGKPQYENVPVSSFISVKDGGAKGDGKTDDTSSIQKVLDSATADDVVYFDHGAYVVTSTVKVPKNIRITGEIWPLIMASGPNFSDKSNPLPVFQIGQPGDVGSMEMSDLIFETLGPAPGAIMMEWNIAEGSQGSCAMWDVHFRIGGSAGTELQSDTCSKNENVTTTASADCTGAFMMLHITKTATAYIENTWYWVADHELDLADHNQINIWNGRGVLVESQGPVWMYGTASEHSQLYNYELSNAKNVFMALIQTETAYMQSNPNALDGGFTPNATYNDPTFADCTTDSCKKTWGLRVVQSSDVYMYGGGLYSFFDNYDQECLAGEECQENMVDIECSSDLYLYGLSTKASVNMVTLNGESAVTGLDNMDNFCQTIALFQQ